MEIYASYGNIESASFSVYGEFQSDLFDTIEQHVQAALDDVATEATNAISAAQQDVDDAQEDFDAAVKELEKAQSDVDSAQSDFDSAQRELSGAQDDVDSLCNPPTCSDGKITQVSFTEFVCQQIISVWICGRLDNLKGDLLLGESYVM